MRGPLTKLRRPPTHAIFLPFSTSSLPSPAGCGSLLPRTPLGRRGGAGQGQPSPTVLGGRGARAVFAQWAEKSAGYSPNGRLRHPHALLGPPDRGGWGTSGRKTPP